MAPRLELQALLVNLLGSNDVYFQPPPEYQMRYPCIVYSRDVYLYGSSRWANNKLYNNRTRYLLTYIDRNPDSDMLNKIANLPMCTFNRSFAADNLTHDVYHLFF